LGKRFRKLGLNFSILDGDNLRSTINQDLGFSKEDRFENNRRVAYIAKILIDSGSYVIVSTVSPFSESRNFAKEIIGEENFFEVYVKATLATCIKRDPKGLYSNKYKKVRNITGIHHEYQVPLNPNFVLDTEKYSLTKLTNDMIKFLELK
jgi:adenylyl-sulfate kinase